jgi:hypothetical protein
MGKYIYHYSTRLRIGNSSYIQTFLTRATTLVFSVTGRKTLDGCQNLEIVWYVCFSILIQYTKETS